MKKIFFVATSAIIFCLFYISVCVASDIKLVKNSTMASFQTTTVGNAFDATFDKPKWEEFKGKKGERVVQFKGKISQNLHNDVTGEIREQFKNMDKSQKYQFRFKFFQAAVEKFGGNKSSYFNKLNQKYDCKELEQKSFSGGMFAYVPECDDKANVNKYFDETINDFLNETWKTGTPVTVQWIITPNGESFNIAYMGSVAWEGLAYENILEAIYK